MTKTISEIKDAISADYTNTLDKLGVGPSVRKGDPAFHEVVVKTNEIHAKSEKLYQDAMRIEAEKEKVKATEPDKPLTRSEIIDNVPIMFKSSDIYNEEKTIDKITLLLAYNLISHGRVLEYSSKMKPLTKKDGKQTSKFYPLSEEQLAECRDDAKELKEEMIAREELEAKMAYQPKPATVFMSTEEEQTLAKRVKAAGNIYSSGNFLKFCNNRFKQVWYNDGYVLEAIMYQAAVSRIKNADDGIHLHIAGDTQTGKSDSVKTALQFVHPSDRLNKKFSKAWIYYAPEGELHERTILFSDDTSFTQEEAEFFRAILTSWKTGCERGTVKNQEAINQTIPPRISLILTSIDSVCKESDEGQDESRYLTIKISRTEDDNAKIREFIQKTHADISEELEIINVIWNTIGNSVEITQHRELDKDITFREFKRYLALIKAHALLMGRTVTDDTDIAAIDKFLTYSNPMINSTTSGLTKIEKLVDACLSYDVFKDTNTIAVAAGLTWKQVAKAIRGKDGTFSNPKGGLLDKPGYIPIQERNEDDAFVWAFKKCHISCSGQLKIDT